MIRIFWFFRIQVDRFPSPAQGKDTAHPSPLNAEHREVVVPSAPPQSSSPLTPPAGPAAAGRGHLLHQHLPLLAGQDVLLLFLELPAVFEISPFGVAPEAFEGVEVAGFLAEDVDDKVDVVEQHPAPGVGALDVPRLCAPKPHFHPYLSKYRIGAGFTIALI